MKVEIVALHAGTTLNTEKGLPDRILVCPWGARDTRKGKVIVNETTLRTLPAMQRHNKREEAVLDFEHNTVPGSKTFALPAKHAGKGKVEVVAGEGIYLTGFSATPEGNTHAKDYADISPAIVRNAKGEVIFLHSAALTHHGEIDDLTLFASDLDLQTHESMYKELILTMLGLPAEADDDAIKSAVEEYVAQKEAKAKEVEDKPSEDEAKIDAMSAEIAALKARIDATDARHSSDARQRLIDRASADGKVIPLTAEQIEKLPIDTLSALVDNLPSTVPMDRRTAQVEQFSATSGEGPEAAEVRKLLGISKEAWDKHNSTAN